MTAADPSPRAVAEWVMDRADVMRTAHVRDADGNFDLVRTPVTDELAIECNNLSADVARQALFTTLATLGGLLAEITDGGAA